VCVYIYIYIYIYISCRLQFFLSCFKIFFFFIILIIPNRNPQTTAEIRRKSERFGTVIRIMLYWLSFDSGEHSFNNKTVLIGHVYSA